MWYHNDALIQVVGLTFITRSTFVQLVKYALTSTCNSTTAGHVMKVNNHDRCFLECCLGLMSMTQSGNWDACHRQIQYFGAQLVVGPLQTCCTLALQDCQMGCTQTGMSRCLTYLCLNYASFVSKLSSPPNNAESQRFKLFHICGWCIYGFSQAAKHAHIWAGLALVSKMQSLKRLAFRALCSVYFWKWDATQGKYVWARLSVHNCLAWCAYWTVWSQLDGSWRHTSHILIRFNHYRQVNCVCAAWIEPSMINPVSCVVQGRIAVYLTSHWGMLE